MNQIDIKSNKVSISAIDGYQLSALVLEPSSELPKAVIQFHSGTVTKKEYYLKIGKFLAFSGYVVVLFDYRGVGESKPKNLKGFDASISDWGSLDASGINKWIANNYPKLKIHLLAHSMGGQIYGLMKEWRTFEKVVLLTTSSGNYNNFSNKWQVKIPANLVFPIIIRALGYVPGYLGLGEDWPKGIADDWMTNSQQNGLMTEYLTKKSERSFYYEIDKEITAWFFPDDHTSTPITMKNLAKSYPNANINTRIISPSDVNLKSIGHFGLFKEKAAAQLWPMLLDEFEK